MGTVIVLYAWVDEQRHMYFAKGARTASRNSDCMPHAALALANGARYGR